MQAQVTSAAAAAIAAASGLAPTNMTVDYVVIMKPDGSSTVTFLLTSALSVAVNTTTTVSESLYADNAKGAVAEAVKLASGGDAVSQMASFLSAAAQRAVADAASLVNGTTMTGDPPASLAVRVANAATKALLAEGKSSVAALVNSSRLDPKGAASAGAVIVGAASGIMVTSGDALSAESGVAAGLAVSELTAAGGGTGAAFVILTALIVYAVHRFAQKHRKALSKVPHPQTLPPLHATKSYSELQQSQQQSQVTNPLHIRRNISVESFASNPSSPSAKAPTTPKGKESRI